MCCVSCCDVGRWLWICSWVGVYEVVGRFGMIGLLVFYMLLVGCQRW